VNVSSVLNEGGSAGLVAFYPLTVCRQGVSKGSTSVHAADLPLAQRMQEEQEQRGIHCRYNVYGRNFSIEVQGKGEQASPITPPITILIISDLADFLYGKHPRRVVFSPRACCRSAGLCRGFVS
jgi:hypothetical protein